MLCGGVILPPLFTFLELNPSDDVFDGDLNITQALSECDLSTQTITHILLEYIHTVGSGRLMEIACASLPPFPNLPPFPAFLPEIRPPGEVK